MLKVAKGLSRGFKIGAKRMKLANATLKKIESCKCEEYAELINYINKKL